VPYLRIQWQENVTVLVRGSRQFLGALVKLRKANFSSVCPFFNMEKLGSDWVDFQKKFDIFGKSVKKIQVSLKSDKHNGYLTRRPI
jgi:hypothetical protein